MMTSPTEISNSYDLVKSRRRNPRHTLLAPSSSSDELEEPGQNIEAGAPSVPPSRNQEQPSTSTPRIPNRQVKIRNTYSVNNRNPHPAGTSNPAGTSSGKQKRSEVKGRKGWSKEENTTLMKLYYKSNPSTTGYRRRLYYLWQEEEMEREVNEQQLAGQVNSIKKGLKKNHLNDRELMELQALHTPDTASSSSTSTRPPRRTKEERKTAPKHAIVREFPLKDLTNQSTPAEERRRPAEDRRRG